MNDGVVQGLMDSGICGCCAYGAFWCPLALNTSAANGKWPKQRSYTQCSMQLLRILLVHATRTPLPAVLTFCLDKDVGSLPLLCLSSGLLFFRYLCSAIDNRTVYTNGGKFDEELNLASFKLLAKLPNLRPRQIFPLYRILHN